MCRESNDFHATVKYFLPENNNYLNYYLECSHMTSTCLVNKTAAVLQIPVIMIIILKLET